MKFQRLFTLLTLMGIFCDKILPQKIYLNEDTVFENHKNVLKLSQIVLGKSSVDFLRENSNIVLLCISFIRYIDEIL